MGQGRCETHIVGFHLFQCNTIIERLKAKETELALLPKEASQFRPRGCLLRTNLSLGTVPTVVSLVLPLHPFLTPALGLRCLDARLLSG